MDNLKIPFFLPTFQVIPSLKIILPHIYLQPDFKERLPLFYAQRRKEVVETFVEGIPEVVNGTSYNFPIRLKWNDKLGLTNISVGFAAGLNLEDDVLPKFTPHNLGITNGYIAGIIAMQYVAELGKVNL